MTRTDTAAALLAVGCAIVAWALPNLGSPDARPAAIVIGYAALFLPYAAILFAARAAPNRRTFIAVAAAAVLARLFVLPADPVLSDDLFRYVWEGRVSLSGANPFVLAPSSPELAHLRDEAIWPLINHPDIPTIYPPFSQAFFALNALLGGGLILMKALFVAFEAAMVAAVWWCVRGRVAAAKLVFAFAIYAANPLVIMEVAWSGHLDVLAWGALVAGLAVWESDSELGWKTVGLTALLVGVSISAKLLGVLALPFLLTGRAAGRTDEGADEGRAEELANTARGWPRITRPVRRFAAIGLALLVVAVSYAPFADAGGRLFSGFGTYASTWRSNEGGYRAMASFTQTALERLASDEDRVTPGDPASDVVFRIEAWDDFFRARGWTKTWKGEELPNTTFTAYTVAQTAAKTMAAFLCGLALLWLMIARWRPLAATGALLLVLYFFAPTVHPWYIAWLVPFAALRPRPAPLLFSALVLVGYGAWISLARGGPWEVAAWAVTLEYGLIAAVLLVPNKTPLIVEDLDTFPS